jgi:hypothetical protein
MGERTPWNEAAERLLDSKLSQVLAWACQAEDGRSMEQITTAPQYWLALVRIRCFTERYSSVQAPAVAIRVEQQLAVIAIGNIAVELDGGQTFALLLDRDGVEWLRWRTKPVGCGPDLRAAALDIGAVPFLPWQDLAVLLVTADAALAASPRRLERNGMTITTTSDHHTDTPHLDQNKELAQ